MNILDQVTTFTEATRALGKSRTFFNDMCKANKLIEGKHYKTCGGTKLILVSVVESIRNKTFDTNADVKIVVSETTETVTRVLVK